MTAWEKKWESSRFRKSISSEGRDWVELQNIFPIGSIWEEALYFNINGAAFKKALTIKKSLKQSLFFSWTKSSFGWLLNVWMLVSGFGVSPPSPKHVLATWNKKESTFHPKPAYRERTPSSVRQSGRVQSMQTIHSPRAPFPCERWRHVSGPCWFQLTAERVCVCVCARP